MSYAPGQTLRWNFYFGGQLSHVCPVRVVVDSAEGLVLWLCDGSPVWRAELPGGVHLRDIPRAGRPVGGYPLRAGHWRRGNSLIYQPTGAAHATWWGFTGDLTFEGWYVNLEHRTRRGEDIDVVDLELDLSVAPDRSWRLEDEESFAEKTGEPGYWTAEEATAIRAEAHRVARLADAGAFPFDGRWCDFVPPRAWAVPSLPPRPATAVLPA